MVDLKTDTATVDAAELSAPVLEMRAISKRFGATQALSGVSLQLRRGDVHALLGENGAGKSTLIKIMTGVQSPDSGEILLDGQPIRLASSQDAQRHGIAAMYQEPMIFPDLSVAENIFIGHRNRGKIVDRRRMERKPARCWTGSGCRSRCEPARGLTLAEQQTVEIAKAISLDVRVLIMDEPTASLSAHEAQRLFASSRTCARRAWRFCSFRHRMDEVFEIAEPSRILRDGQWISTSPRADLTPRAAIRDMVGRQVEEIFPRNATPPARCLAQGAGLAGPARSRTFHLKFIAGEVLGFAGLVGARRTDVGLALFGIAPAEAGEIELDGQPIKSRSARARRMDLGIAYSHRGPPPARADHAAVDCQQYRRCRRCRAISPRSGWSSGRTRMRLRRRIASGSTSGRRRSMCRGGAFGRQSAEGGHQQMAGNTAEGADPR